MISYFRPSTGAAVNTLVARCRALCTQQHPTTQLQQHLEHTLQPGYVDQVVHGIRSGDRLSLSRAITLCESSRPDHVEQAGRILQRLVEIKASLGDAAASGSLPRAQQPPSSFRIGISGPPGVGKSTLIEALGCCLADSGHKVAVLAVDPSSQATGGSILGDKTRMPRLSTHSQAYVRPSPARGTLGGISRATYDTMQLCEAAGYDRIVVETVGVGQSEVAVADLADCMLLVVPPVGGDELQMIKRGVMEVADVVAVNKADGATAEAAARAAQAYRGALQLLKHRYHSWQPHVLQVSARTGRNLEQLGACLDSFKDHLARSGELLKHRRLKRQAITRMAMEEDLLERLRGSKATAALLGQLMPQVADAHVAPRRAARTIVDHFLQQAGPR